MSKRGWLQDFEDDKEERTIAPEETSRFAPLPMAGYNKDLVDKQAEDCKAGNHWHNGADRSQGECCPCFGCCAPKAPE